MNTDFSMCTATAIKAVSLINIGETVEVEIDKILQNLKVVAKDTYTVTVQGETNRILCPIGWTTIYRNLVKKEPEDMTRLPVTAASGAKGPGRPRKGAGAVAAPAVQPGPPQTQAAPTQPAPNHFLPPGSTAQPTHAAPAEEAQSTEIAAQWVRDEITKRCAELQNCMENLFVSILEREPEPAPEMPPARLTCADCKHSNLSTGMCDKWNIIPPMNVICNAQAMCTTGFEAEDVGADIPYE